MDDGLELKVSKTSVLPKGVTQQVAFYAAHIINDSPVLTYLTGDVLLVSFCPAGLVGIGVSIDTDAFVQKLVVDTCNGFGVTFNDSSSLAFYCHQKKRLVTLHCA